MRSSYQYHDRDYAFGNLCVTLRTRLGITQGELARLLKSSERAIQAWEAGDSYPKVDSLKRYIELCVKHHAFAASHEEEEIRALWKAAHQRVILNETWLSTLLAPATCPQEAVEGAKGVIPAETVTPKGGIDTQIPVPTPVSRAQTYIDWVGALDVSTFIGREVELADLSRWIMQEHCRLIAVLGIGGIGKSSLVSLLGHQLTGHFEVVLWRSVRDAPSCEDLVADCISFCSETPPAEFSSFLEQRINQLVARLQDRRCLLVLDNLETLLQEGDPEGNYRPGYEGYGRLIQRLAESAHQSCVVLTSREKPREIEALEGQRTPVRSLRLSGLSEEVAYSLLKDKDLHGTSTVWRQFIATYAGNPLALKIVGQAIVDLFGGDLEAFLQSGELIFNGIRAVLRQQVARLTPLEQTLLTWLAVVREWTSLETLLSLQIPQSIRGRVLEALEGLGRRSLIERGQQASFTLQSVVMEYITDALLEQLTGEIIDGTVNHLRRYALEQARAKDYVRQTQVRLLVQPLLERLRATFGSETRIEEQFLTLLTRLRTEDINGQGYAPANLVALLQLVRGHLRCLDLSHLALRGVFLQGVQMQDANLSGASLQDSVFTEPFDAIPAIAISSTGQYWAAATWRGEVRVWAAAGQILHQVWQAHIASVPALAFSPDGRRLASVSWDNTVKLWDVESSTLLWAGRQTGGLNGVAFAPDGRLLASGGGDTDVQVWDAHSGTNVQRLSAQTGTVYSLAWSQDGRRLASGCSDGSIWVWEPQMPEPDLRVRRLWGHTHWVTGLAFAPDGAQLASASFDGTIKLWDMESFDCLQTFSWHTDRAMRVAWSPDGRTLASCSFDRTIWLWDLKEGRSRAVLRGHTALIYIVAFTPDSRNVLSGSDDSTIRVWDVESGQCLRIIGGYTTSLFDVDWSPDGTHLASGGGDTLVTLWDAGEGTSPRVLRGHQWIVQGVAWSPDGHLLASAGYDNCIGLWDTATGVCLEMLRDPDAVDTIFQGVAWSPDGRLLACGSYLRGVQVWDMTTCTRRWIGRTQPTRIRRVAWSPDGTRMAGGGDDGYVYLWNATDGTPQQLAGHQGVVMSVAFSPDGRRLASAGSGKEGGELFVWEAHSGERAQTLVGQSGMAFAVAWSPSGELLISGGDDGMLRWWEVQSEACVRVREAHQGTVQALKVSPDGSILASCGDDGAIRLWDLESGEPLHTLRRDRLYERLNITGIRGLTEAQKASLRALGAFEETSVGGEMHARVEPQQR